MAAVIQAPCKGCEKREIGCHGWCKAYLAYQEENNMYKAMSANNRKSLSPTYLLFAMLSAIASIAGGTLFIQFSRFGQTAKERFGNLLIGACAILVGVVLCVLTALEAFGAV